MPLVRISLRQGKSEAYRRALADGVHRALVETLKVPEADRFQLVSEYAESGLIYHPNYLEIARTDSVVFVQITLNTGRTTELKKAFYARVVELLAESPGVRKEDLLISLLEVNKENWSFGNGIAQYA